MTREDGSHNVYYVNSVWYFIHDYPEKREDRVDEVR